MTMEAFDPNSLFAKSRIFIERGLAARDSGEYDVFHMWAALSLELLGKAALASVHPALVADPSRIDSLLYACGRKTSDDVKSIGAKTIYERLPKLSKDFDQRMRDFCMLMANRRNEELHSAASPTSDLDPKTWIPTFWRAAEVILEISQRQLLDWVGKEEALGARTVMEDASRILEHALQARIARCRRAFDEKYPPGSVDRKVLLENLENVLFPIGQPRLRYDADGHDREKCPSCNSPGWVFGFQFERHRNPVEYDRDHHILMQTEERLYVTTDFSCGACGLVINGVEEIEAADLRQEFSLTKDVEPDYGGDYGND